MRKNKLLIIICPILFFISLAAFSVSCTSDYFVDETNYLVHVPEVADGSARECHVFIYDQNGNLAGNRSAYAPYTNIYRIEDGIFAFMLPPGSYEVFCFINTDSVSILETSSLATARMRTTDVTGNTDLIGADFVPYAFSSPPDILYDNYTTTIENSLMHEDTATLSKYTGRITVLFKNFPLPAASIASTRIFAYGVGRSLYFNQAATVDSESDFMFAYQAKESPAAGFDFQVDHKYFPSVEGELMRLNIRFFDQQQGVVGTIDMELRDPVTGEPLELKVGERLIVEVDKYLINNVSIVGWNDTIESGGGIVVE